MQGDWVHALLGGVLIGVSASLMLLWNGRVAGVSGIVSGLLRPKKGDVSWRLMFISGLFSGGLLMERLNPHVFENSLRSADWTVVVAGLLVGFGTVMGSGCTSGHGICGISRFSIRSLMATLIFIGSGVVSVFIFRSLGVLE